LVLIKQRLKPYENVEFCVFHFRPPDTTFGTQFLVVTSLLRTVHSSNKDIGGAITNGSGKQEEYRTS